MKKSIGSQKSLPRQRQQGDVLLDLVPLPRELTRKPGRAILALGEATGHAHEVLGDGVQVYEAEDGTLYVTAETDAQLTHQEHRAQVVPATPPGMAWRRRIVREYDHFEEEARNVAD
jgi:hypothetical protein